jgi:hypothetical protein
MGCASAVAASVKQLEARSGELQCLPNCKSFELLKRKALRARKRKRRKTALQLRWSSISAE